MMIALTAAFVAAFPVNRYLIDKGKGHALTHRFHLADHPSAWGAVMNTSTLAAGVIGFLLGGLVVSVAAELEDDSPAPPSHSPSSHPLRH